MTFIEWYLEHKKYFRYFRRVPSFATALQQNSFDRCTFLDNVPILSGYMMRYRNVHYDIQYAADI